MIFYMVAIKQAMFAPNQGFQLPFAFMQTLEAEILTLAPQQIEGIEARFAAME
jgi:hypothetical protein